MNASFATAAVAIAVSLAGLAMPASAVAAPAAEARSVTQAREVSLESLDLATPEGQRALERRIRKAARNVCGMDDIVTGTRLETGEARACYAKALRDARARVAEVVAHRRAAG